MAPRYGLAFPMVISQPEDPKPTRAHRLPTAILIALCVMLIGATAASAAVPSTFFGVSVVRPTAKDYQQMPKLGVGVARIEIAWRAVEPDKASGFRWGGVDQRVKRAASQGIRVLPVLFGTPKWVSGTGEHVKSPIESKKGRKRFAGFVSAAAGRYGPGGSFWQEHPGLNAGLASQEWVIWNEMNARNFWWPKVDPGEYASLLRVSRKALDEVDPGLSITTGGMYGFPGHPNSMRATEYLTKLYRQKGMTQIIDRVSLHPYASNVKGVRAQVKDVRKVIKRSGDAGAGILIGEIGWASGGSPKSYFLIKGKKSQARLLRQSYQFFLAKRRSWNIDGAMWFSLNDYSGAEVCNWCPKAGLLNEKGRLKPSGVAYRKIAGAN